MTPIDPIVAVLSILQIAPDVAATAASIIQQCQAQGRDPTPEEVDELKQRQATVEQAWKEGRPAT